MLIGVDTSPEMISMANFLSHPQRMAYNASEFLSANSAAFSMFLDARGMTLKQAFVKAKRAIANFSCANAEATSLPDKAFDLVTVMYAFHETPQSGRTKILAEAHRLLHKGGILALLDISPEYQPSKTMLAGEPYVLEYQQNINRQLRTCKGFTRATFRNIVPGHLGLWLLQRI
jgi:ubiquinone/menaquinone biosynthesis C-methylase UbiE